MCIRDRLSDRTLYDDIASDFDGAIDIIGGAHVAAELDAKAAIKQASYAAAAV